MREQSDVTNESETTAEPRAPWRTPVVIVSEIRQSETKYAGAGDFTSGGFPFGS